MLELLFPFCSFTLDNMCVADFDSVCIIGGYNNKTVLLPNTSQLGGLCFRGIEGINGDDIWLWRRCKIGLHVLESSKGDAKGIRSVEFIGGAWLELGCHITSAFSAA